MIEIIAEYWRPLLLGLRQTMILAAGALGIGLVGGVGLAVLRMSPTRVLRWPAGVFIQFFRTTPLISQLVLFYFLLPAWTNVEMSAFTTGLVTLGMNQCAYMAETIRGGLQAVPGGQRHAASVLGLGSVDTFRYILLPQATATVLPALVAQSMLAIKGTAYVAVLSVNELTHTGTRISLETFSFLDVYIVIASVYFVLIFPLGLAGQRLESRLVQRWR